MKTPKTNSHSEISAIGINYQEIMFKLFGTPQNPKTVTVYGHKIEPDDIQGIIVAAYWRGRGERDGIFNPLEMESM